MVEEKSSRNSEEGFWSSLARILTVVTYAYQNWARSAENKFVIHNENEEIKEMVEAFWHSEREWAMAQRTRANQAAWSSF